MHEEEWAPGGSVLMRITFKPDGSACRQFDRDDKDTLAAASVLDEKHVDFERNIEEYADALATIHDMDKEVVKAKIVLPAIKKHKPREEQPVQWYWAEFFQTLRATPVPGERSSAPCPRYVVTVKACRDFYFYTLMARGADGISRFLHTPFFERSAPPDNVSADGDSAQARGVADTLIFLAPRLDWLRRTCRKYDLVEELSWFDIQWTCEVQSASRESVKLGVTWKAHEPKPEIRGPREAILVSSPNVRQAMKNLAEAWLDPRVKCVLVSAGSGSGKERLIQFLGDALMVDDRRITLAAPEVKSMDRFTKRLHNDQNLNLRKLPPPSPGAPSLHNPPHDRRRSLVVIDEIHHPPAQEIRAGLLRLLETNELPTGDGSLVLDCTPITYILAASNSPSDLRLKIKPADLWTRVEYVVEMKHPLDLDGEQPRADALKAYFKMFWDEHRTRWSGFDNPWPVPDKVQTVFGDPKVDCVRDIVSAEFCATFSDPKIAKVSIRELRTIVKRLFGRSVTFARTRDELDDIDDIATALDDLRKRCGQWIVELSCGIVPAPHDDTEL